MSGSKGRGEGRPERGSPVARPESSDRGRPPDQTITFGIITGVQAATFSSSIEIYGQGFSLT